MLDVDLITVELNQSAKHLGSGSSVDLEQVDLNELVVLVLVKITSQLLNEVMHVAQVDQRSRIGKLHLLQEVLDLNWVIESSFADHSFNFLVVSKSSASLDVLKVDIRIIGVRKHIGKIDKETLVGSEALKDLNALLSVDFAGILNCYLSY